MDSTIGIKIANGEFYPIVQENSSVKKRLIITTVHDNQKSMQIDLYKSFTRSMADALYIGSIVVEKIKPKTKGEPSVELIITSGEDGQVQVDAKDLDPSIEGEPLHLDVALRSLEEDQRAEGIPDFELESNADSSSKGLYERAKIIREEEQKKGFPWFLVLILGLLLILLFLGIWFFLIREKSPGDRSARPVSSAESPIRPAPPPPPEPRAEAPVSDSRRSRAEEAPPAQVTEAPPPPVMVEERPGPVQVIEAVPGQVTETPVQVIEAPARTRAPAQERRPAAARRRQPPVASYKVPAVIPPEGVFYGIRWGDTLWDISEAFYRNPWLYPRIARFNRIPNPDLIIAGDTVRIPPKQ
jgi:hypothetical protein